MMSPISLHNALMTVTQAYGEALAQQHKEIEFLSSQVKSLQAQIQSANADTKDAVGMAGGLAGRKKNDVP